MRLLADLAADFNTSRSNLCRRLVVQGLIAPSRRKRLTADPAADMKKAGGDTPALGESFYLETL
jgi:hypothetical protein